MFVGVAELTSEEHSHCRTPEAGFYRWKRRFDRHDLSTLEEHSHHPRRVRRPTWMPELSERVLSLRKQYPRWGKDKLVQHKKHRRPPWWAVFWPI